MIVLDANILIYAYKPEAMQHPRVRQWLEERMSHREQIGIPWLASWAFLRVVTNPGINANPASTGRAFGIIRDLLQQPNVAAVAPGPRHADILETLITNFQVTPSLFMDGAYAAIAIEQGASLASTDHDFSRFPNLKWINPLA